MSSKALSYNEIESDSNNGSGEIVDFEYKKSFESEKKKLLRSRLKCPKHEEHIRTPKDHEYKYVVAMGNKDRFYCRNHTGLKHSKHNRYEFRYSAEKKDRVALKKLLNSIDETYYERLHKIYRGKKGDYSVRDDDERLVESLIVIGISDTIIGRIFHVDRATIYRLAKKKGYKKNLIYSY